MSNLSNPATATEVDRRSFCACALALGTMAACGGGGGGGTTPAGGGGGGGTIATTDTKAGLLAQPAGTVRDYTSSSNPCPGSLGTAQGVYLVRDAAGIYAVSASCLHLGGRIQPLSGGFSCGCHGSQYDLNGTVTHGPAPVGSVLAHYEVKESTPGGTLTINPAVTVSAGTRLS